MGTKQHSEKREVTEHEAPARAKEQDAPLENLEGSAHQALRAVLDLRRQMDERFHELDSQIKDLRTELHSTDIVAAAAHLRALNESSAHSGLGRLRTALHAMREAGVVDHDGKRVKHGLPPGMMEDAPDAI